MSDNDTRNENTGNYAVGLFVIGLRTDADPLFLKKINSNNYDNSNFKKSIPEWADQDWISKKKNFRRCSNKYSRYPSEQNRASMVNARSSYKQTTRLCIKRHKNAQTQRLIKARFNNVKEYWRLLSNSRKQNKPLVSLQDFYYHFMSLSNPEDDFYTADSDVIDEFNEMMNNEMHIMFEELNAPFELSDIENSVKQLKTGKCSGEDLMINELFIYGKDVLSPYLLKLFNFIFDSGCFPNMWSDGLLIALHKKGNYSNPENFRGITLLSALGKLFTRVVNNRLNMWAEQYSIYIEAQYGFRKGRSTTDCIFILQNVIDKFVQNNQRLYAFFIDYSKAFDYVVRENLWFKLMKCGIGGKMLKMIQSMYSDVKTRVFVNGNTSEPYKCKLGVRQGECLSPFLFAVYVNDLEEKLSENEAGICIQDLKLVSLFYADDVVIFSSTQSGLQSEIDRLYDYCNKWKLKLNTDKSKVVVFGKRTSRITQTWKFGNKELIVTSKLPYLGVTFTSTGSGYQAQLTLSEQANKAIFSLMKKLNHFSNLKPDIMLDLFDKFIAPILNYGSEVWGFHPAPDIERIHTKFCKKILGIKKSTQNDFVYGELGRLPMQFVRFVRIVKYWLSIVLGKKSLYVSKIYQLSISEMETSHISCWSLSVKYLLLSHGFGEAWYNQGVGDPTVFISLFKQRLIDTNSQNWRSRLEESSRARFYRVIRPEQNFQKYLTVVVPATHRAALARLLCSSHTLNVETGRWKRPLIPYERRFCNVCNMKIEDEYHIIFECPLYEDLRKQLIPYHFRVRPSMYKLISLINSNNDKTIKAFAKFVYLSFKLRKELND